MGAMKTKATLLSILSVALVAGTLRAEDDASAWPINLGLFPPVQIADAEDDVRGLQIGLLWDESRDLYGISVGGLGNFAHREMKGAELSLGCNWAESGYGIAWAGAFNRFGGDFSGWTRAIGANLCEGTLRGYQDALFSNYAHDLYGVQLGCVNTAHSAHGVQIGLVNLVEDMCGVQIGVLNFIRHGSLPFFPIVNACF